MYLPPTIMTYFYSCLSFNYIQSLLRPILFIRSLLSKTIDSTLFSIKLIKTSPRYLHSDQRYQLLPDQILSYRLYLSSPIVIHIRFVSSILITMENPKKIIHDNCKASETPLPKTVNNLY